MKRILILFLVVLSLPLFAQKKTAEEILRLVDKNRITNTIKIKSRMIVHSRRASRTLEAVSYAEGNGKFYCEYLSPAQEKGTKMLKLGEDLWIFDPATDRSIQISGSMLKQSLVGSDLSYEDMMEVAPLQENYTAEIQKEIKHEGRKCWVLNLIAKNPDESYHKRIIYVDKERYVSLYEEWYGKNGKLLKTVEASSVKNIDGRWVPTKYVFKDKLKQGKGTEYYLEEIQINPNLPAYIFNKAMLHK